MDAGLHAMEETLKESFEQLNANLKTNIETAWCQG